MTPADLIVSKYPEPSAFETVSRENVPDSQVELLMMSLNEIMSNLVPEVAFCVFRVSLVQNLHLK